MTLPRVASGRCQVAAIGMRLDARTKSDEVLKAWADQHKLPFIGVLRETQGYVRCIERGLTLFDMPADKIQADLAQWQPILDWLAPSFLRPEPAKAEKTKAKLAAQVARATTRNSSPAEIATPVPAAQARTSTSQTAAPRATVLKPTAPTMINRVAALLSSLTRSRFSPR
jgi:chromosome partitioning protein